MVGNENRIWLYAETLVNFANAKNLGDAFFTLANDIEKAFGLEKGLVKNIEKYPPFCRLDKIEGLVPFRELLGLTIWIAYPPVRSISRPSSKPINFIPFSIEDSYINNIDDIMLLIQTVIKGLCENLRLSEIEHLRDLLLVYTVTIKPVFAVPGDSICFLPPFEEHDDFFAGLHGNENEPYQADIRQFIYALNYILVHYLIQTKGTKPPVIRQCPYCDRYFAGKSKARARCYSQECEKAYQREKKRKQRDNEPAKYV